MRLDVGFRFNFLPIPTDIHFGYGVLDTLPERLDGLHGKKAFLITDTGLKDVGILDQIERILKSSKRDFLVYDGVEPDSGSDLIAEATSRLRSSSADVVVGIGGGSSLDTAKAVAVMATNTGSIVDYVGLNKVPHRPLPVIAIPTTAGTGSEVSLWSVFRDRSTSLKVSVGGVSLYPAIALCDPGLTLSLPPSMTASTGMDALTHAIECYTNRACQPISGALALRAIELIGQHLRTAVLNGDDRESRYGMLLASTMAGIAMNPTRLGVAHALAMPLGSWALSVPHGMANAITLPIVMKFNCLAKPERFAEVARALGERVDSLPLREAAARASQAVRVLAEDVAIPRGLSQFGVKPQDIPSIVEEAMKSGNVAVNPRHTSKEDLSQLLSEALQY